MRPASLLSAVTLVALAALSPMSVALPADTGDLAARSPSQLEAREAIPSPEARRSLAKRKQRVMTEEELISHYLCPQPMRVCPLTNVSRPSTLEEWISEGYECVDDFEDLTSCGGCSTVDDR